MKGVKSPPEQMQLLLKKKKKRRKASHGIVRERKIWVFLKFIILTEQNH